MRFLVLGASGMAGHLISAYLKEVGHDVIGFSRRKLDFVNSITGDARDLESLKNIIVDGKFDVVVNAIGILNNFAENDHEAAVFLNGYLPHYLAKITSDMNTKVIQMSTDCVFSGKKAPYKENDFPDGESYYDRTKAIGELVDTKNLTLRNSIVGPDINECGIGLFNWFMKQRGTIKGYTHAMWTGMTTLQLAKTIEHAAEDGICGLINMVPSHNISKYKLLILFNEYCRDGAVQIVPYDDFILDKTLIRTNDSWSYEVPSYEIMVKEMHEWIENHKNLYPHYYNY